MKSPAVRRLVTGVTFCCAMLVMRAFRDRDRERVERFRVTPGAVELDIMGVDSGYLERKEHFNAAIERKTFAEIERRGGSVSHHYQELLSLGLDQDVLDNVPNFNVCCRTEVTNGDLKHMREHLEKLPTLGNLILADTKITDAGLEHLVGLTNIEALDLRCTEITDAGLDYIKGLTSLKRLLLKNTHVTDEGVKKLREALPNCEIERLPTPTTRWTCSCAADVH